MKTYHHIRSIRRKALSHIQNNEDAEIQEEIGAKVPCVDDEEDKESEIKSDREALQMAEKLHLEYARFKGNEKLSLVLSKSKDLFEEKVMRNEKQSSIFDYFKK